MTKVIINNPLTYDYKKELNRTTKIYPASLTIPDQSLTVRDIINKHSRNQPITGYQEGFYNEDENAQGIKLGHLDPVDQQEFIENHKKKLEELQAKRDKEIKAENLAREEAQKKAAKDFYLQGKDLFDLEEKEAKKASKTTKKDE